jgi:hypothetical protein
MRSQTYLIRRNPPSSHNACQRITSGLTDNHTIHPFILVNIGGQWRQDVEGLTDSHTIHPFIRYPIR